MSGFLREFREFAVLLIEQINPLKCFTGAGEPARPPAPTRREVLLEEIRDILKKSPR